MSSTPKGGPIDELLARTCAKIAPTWPLDRFIAVNPFWEMTDRSLPSVATTLASLSGTRLLMPRAWFFDRWRAGELTDADLDLALARASEDEARTTLPRLHALLQAEEPQVTRRPRLMDLVDRERDLVHQMSWRDFVVHSTSQLCASYFDEGQAQLGPDREGGLYACWRRYAIADRSPTLLMGHRHYAAIASRLPKTAREMAVVALEELGVAENERETYLLGLLLDINGWASWCAYRRWTAKLAGDDSEPSMRDLLAIRLAWEWMLLRSGGATLATRWRAAMATWPVIDAEAKASRAGDWLLQSALEIAWQRRLCGKLTAPRSAASSAVAEPAIQAVFCIDVRSEVFRRAFERESGRVTTLGFAGFFGLPIEYLPIGSAHARPQLPGLLAPRLRVTDEGVPPDLASRRGENLTVEGSVQRVKTGAISSFSFVEALGVTFAGKLLADGFGLRLPGFGRAEPERAGLSAEEHARRKPRLEGMSAGERSELAAGMLRGMSLTHDFARLVLLVGHGSETRNNAHAAGLDCGACCGQTGEVNARAAAALLNDADVRKGLKTSHGIVIPPSTRFVAGLHNTTTDDVTLFDLDELPAEHRDDVASARAWLSRASVNARKERAPSLGLTSATDDENAEAIRSRARDWAEVRPEWGLTNNAAFIVGPRELTRHVDLEGRSFLHEYRSEEDRDFAILELIMTAPMIVTHWINLQYYASTVDNVRYGSGNKLLHNVVGGHIGVFEGNGGDLRIGLPMQSIHDGERFLHTPLRLSVFIAAPREAIEGVLRKHEKVRALVDNEWLYLFQIDVARDAKTPPTLHAYRRGAFHAAFTTEGA